MIQIENLTKTFSNPRGKIDVLENFSLTDIFQLNDKSISTFRNAHIGFISQEQSFLENLTVLDNVRLPYFLGGENHRVLIARALMNNPAIILADEPTESVETELSKEIVRIFQNLATEGKTVLLVSHDEKVFEKCGKKIELGNIEKKR